MSDMLKSPRQKNGYEYEHGHLGEMRAEPTVMTITYEIIKYLNEKLKEFLQTK